MKTSHHIKTLLYWSTYFILIGILIYLVYLIFKLTPEGYSLILSGHATNGIKFAMFCAVVAAAIILYMTRLRHRIFYGIIEILFAMAAAVGWINLTDKRMVGEWVAVAAIVYVIVRGSDNIHQGWKDWKQSKKN